MNTARLWVMSVLTMGLAAVLSGCESTDQAAAGREPSWYWGVPAGETDTSQQGLPGTQVGANLHRATELVGLPIRNLAGEQLGSIYDLVLTPDLSGVSYMAASDAKGFHAIPWSAVQTEPDGNLTIAISEQELAQDPGFREWPAEGNPRWLDRAGEQAQGAEPGTLTAMEPASIQDRRFNHLEGMAVSETEGRKIGTIRDLVVSTETGAVAYTIVSTGGFLGLGRQYAAVPRNAVDLDLGQWVARVDADRETLQANAFSPGAFPNLSDPLYVQQLNQAYGLEYGTVLGYVPGEE